MRKLMNWLLKKPTIDLQRPSEPIRYPSGVCVGTETGWFYIKGPTKIKINTVNILQSWSFNTVIYGSDSALSNYRLSSNPLGFRDGTLLKNFADGKMYLVSDNKTRHILNPEWLRILGLQDYNILVVSDSEIKIHEQGDALP